MRHRVYGKKLGRTKNERTALFRNLVQSLLISESIETTETKAKAIKGLIDKLVNQAKTPATRRLVSQFLTNKTFSEKLIKDIAPRLKDRNSGYTSIIKVGRRLGDSSMIVRMSLLVQPRIGSLVEPRTGSLTTPKVEKPAIKEVSKVNEVKVETKKTEEKTKPVKAVKGPAKKLK